MGWPGVFYGLEERDLKRQGPIGAVIGVAGC